MPAAKFDNEDGRLRGRAGVARRLRIWRNHPHCAMCGRLTEYGQGVINPFHIDHKMPLYKGGEDTDQNCQVLCVPCHDSKTEKDMGYRPGPKFDRDGRVQW